MTKFKKPTDKKPKNFWQKAWHFLWYEDSPLSWTVNIILAFILIRFIVYPGLGLLLGTPFPIVAVVSESMEHDRELEKWWNYPMCCNPSCSQTLKPSAYYENIDVSFDEFSKFPLENGFKKGDIMVLIKPEDLKVGDVIVFQSGRPDPIIHRIIKVKGSSYETKGDNNCGQISSLSLDETNIAKENIYGKTLLRIPFLGYVKIWFVDLIDLIR